MIRKIGISAILLLSFVLVANATPIDSIYFSGIWWKPSMIYADDGTAWNNIKGTDGYTWRTDDDSSVFVDGNGWLHERFVRKLNDYYYFPSDPDSNGPNSHRQRNYRILHNLDSMRNPSSPNDWYQKVYERVRDSLVWYEISLYSTTTFRYGKFQWEMATVFPDTFNPHIDAGYWVIDDQNVAPDQFQGNEIDIEFFRFGSQTSWVNGSNIPYLDPSEYGRTWDTVGTYYFDEHNSHTFLQTVMPSFGPQPGIAFPRTKQDSTQNFWERRFSVDGQDANPTRASWRGFSYKPESVTFNSSWSTGSPDLVTNIFPDPNNPITRVGWGTDRDPITNAFRYWQSDSMIVPPCGRLTRARISMLHLRGNHFEWDPVNRRYRDTHSIGDIGLTPAQIASGVIEFVTKSFTYIGIPDLSITDTLGAPWPWATGEWHPSGWNKSILVTTDSSVTTTTINSTHSCDTIRYGERAWVYWAVHNVGTDSIPSNTPISTTLYDNNTPVCTFQRQYSSPISVNETLFDSALVTLEPDNHWLKLITGVDYGGSSLEELRKSNNADSIQVFVAAQDISFKSTNGSWYLPYHDEYDYGQTTPLVCQTDTIGSDWENDTITIGYPVYLKWAMKNIGSVSAQHIKTTVYLDSALSFTQYRDTLNAGSSDVCHGYLDTIPANADPTTFTANVSTRDSSIFPEFDSSNNFFDWHVNGLIKASDLSFYVTGNTPFLPYSAQGQTTPVVCNADGGWSNDSVSSGQNVVIKWAMHNVGNAPTPLAIDFPMVVYLNNSAIDTVTSSPLTVNGVAVKTITYTLPDSVQTGDVLYVVIDPAVVGQGIIGEWDSDNNVSPPCTLNIRLPDLAYTGLNGGAWSPLPHAAQGQTYPVVCNGRPELHTGTPADTSWSIDTLYEMQVAHIRWTTHNIGSAITDTFETKVAVDSNSIFNAVRYCTLDPTSPVGAGVLGYDGYDEGSCSHFFPFNSAGTHTITVTTDVGVDIAESNENNNYKALDVLVMAGPPPIYRGEYVISVPITLPADTTIVAPFTRFFFSDSGRFIVPDSAMLVIQSVDTVSNPDDYVQFAKLDSTLSTSNNTITVQSGGKLIGSKVAFSHLPVAINVNGGKVTLDASQFVDCSTAIEAGSLNDTLTITNSLFTGGTKAIHANYSTNGVLALSHCAFDSQSTRALDVQASKNIDSPGLVDSCTFTGKNKSGTGIYLENCDANFQFVTSTVSNWWHGVEATLSNPYIVGSEFRSNGKTGIRWSNDFPGTSALGRIESCRFDSNGNGNYGAGYYGYAASTVLVCNQFNTELGYGAHCVGTPSPYFYDPDAQTDGANSFYGSDAGFPLVYLTGNAEPTFLYGKNYFLLADSSDIVAEDGSTTPIFHDLKDNNYGSLTVTIDNFDPNDSQLWSFPDCEGGTCEAQMMSLPGGDGGQLMLGDLAAADGNDSAAVQYYNNAITLSGDTTGVGASALARLAKLNPVLPQVGENLETGAFYSASYAYDALGDFAAADAYRDTILSDANGIDSIRVAYDVSVSELLRPTTMAMGPHAAIARERAISRRANLMEQLMVGGRKRANPTTSRDVVVLPTKYDLHPVYPNPFNPVTNVRFDLPEANHVKVTVYDAMGRLVTNLVDGNQAAGYHNVQWNGTTNSSGVYFVTIHTNKYTATRKAVLLK